MIDFELEARFWRTVDELNWPEEKEQTKQRLLDALEDKGLRTEFILWLDRNANRLVKAAHKTEHVEDKAELKLAAMHLIAQGSKASQAAFMDSKKLLQLQASGNYERDFTSYVPTKQDYDSPEARREQAQLTLVDEIEALKLKVAEAEQSLFSLRQELATKIEEHTQNQET